jgi:hypothetical protein
MSKFAALLTLLVAVFTCGLLAAPAQAQRARVFVASYGSDSNPCTFGSPCKTFQHAHDVVADTGEITAIDSAGFGPLVITKGVTVTSPNGVEAGIAVPSGGTGITINTSTNASVTLRGLTLDGFFSGQNGIAWMATGPGGELNIIDCVVKGFTNDGIQVKPAFGAPAGGGMLVSNSIVMDNFINGIEINPQNSSTEIIYTIDRTTVSGNGEGNGGNDSGILINSGSGTVAGSLSSVRVLRNNNKGVTYIGSGSSANNYITSSDLILNGAGDFNLSGSNVVYLFGANTITLINNAGTVSSDGTNDVPFFTGTALQSISRR